MSNFNPPIVGARFSLRALIVALLALLLSSAVLLAQTSVSTGGIVGTVSDPTGALVPGAKVTITNLGTGQASALTTTSSGLYNSGSMIPGNYKVRVEAKGFRTTELPLTVEVGAVTAGNVRLEVGQESQVVEVQGSAETVNTEQATVQAAD
jgi:hypothetical protein